MTELIEEQEQQEQQEQQNYDVIIEPTNKFTVLAVTNKFTNGVAARKAWSKSITLDNTISIDSYNNSCNNNFEKRAIITLDASDKRQTTLISTPIDASIWNSKNEHIYVLTRNNQIMKIGGTRDGLRNRWNSYLCGHCVPERIKKRTGNPFPGKMSVTNAYLYHTIEEDIINTQSNWEFWSWKLPIISLPVEILEEQINVIAQTYHAYESICIKKFKNITGKIPLLCDNSDPNY